jgi:FkbM family methyltransferase
MMTKLFSHIRDYFINKSPLKFRTASKLNVLLHNRSDFELYQQIFVENVFNFQAIKEFIKKNNPVVFDLGANCGFFTLRTLDFFSKAKIYAFEPQIKVKNKFEKIIKANNLQDQISLYQFAIADRNSRSIFYENRSPISASLLKEKVSKRTIRKKYPVQIKSLNWFVKEYNTPLPDILKIDVEGSELDVLKGSADILNKISILFIEVHPPICTANQIKDFLHSFGYVRSKCMERSQKKDQDLVFVNQRHLNFPSD